MNFDALIFQIQDHRRVADRELLWYENAGRGFADAVGGKSLSER